MKRLLRLGRNHWDRTAAICCAAGAGIALLVAWIGVSDTVFTFEQIPFLISGGLLGVCLIAAAAALWVSADLRDEWRKLDRLEEKLGDAGLVHEADAGDATGQPRAAAPNAGPRRLRVSAEG